VKPNIKTNRNTAHVERKNKSDTSKNGDNWNHLKIIQKVPDDAGHALAQLVEALRYKRVRFLIVSLEFLSDIILPAALNL
jgi:hypothetical protein